MRIFEFVNEIEKEYPRHVVQDFGSDFSHNHVMQKDQWNSLFEYYLYKEGIK